MPSIGLAELFHIDLGCSFASGSKPIDLVKKLPAHHSFTTGQHCAHWRTPTGAYPRAAARHCHAAQTTQFSPCVHGLQPFNDFPRALGVTQGTKQSRLTRACMHMRGAAVLLARRAHVSYKSPSSRLLSAHLPPTRPQTLRPAGLRPSPPWATQEQLHIDTDSAVRQKKTQVFTQHCSPSTHRLPTRGQWPCSLAHATAPFTALRGALQPRREDSASLASLPEPPKTNLLHNFPHALAVSQSAN